MQDRWCPASNLKKYFAKRFETLAQVLALSIENCPGPGPARHLRPRSLHHCHQHPQRPRQQERSRPRRLCHPSLNFPPESLRFPGHLLPQKDPSQVRSFLKLFLSDSDNIHHPNCPLRVNMQIAIPYRHQFDAIVNSQSRITALLSICSCILESSKHAFINHKLRLGRDGTGTYLGKEKSFAGVSVHWLVPFSSFAKLPFKLTEMISSSRTIPLNCLYTPLRINSYILCDSGIRPNALQLLANLLRFLSLHMLVIIPRLTGLTRQLLKAMPCTGSSSFSPMRTQRGIIPWTERSLSKLY